MKVQYAIQKFSNVLNLGYVKNPNNPYTELKEKGTRCQENFSPLRGGLPWTYMHMYINRMGSAYPQTITLGIPVLWDLYRDCEGSCWAQKILKGISISVDVEIEMFQGIPLPHCPWDL
ncbi:hypothetical protein BDZ94DRAFT_1240914 [Collybia nuda]|uniref:Uncharacterized protein n=1 Tax=Collybia nuda TaxID=64659 RepID=A0A9P5XX18_9AGAR|nr:hypothetical protein BDZ94DRAFT_1240914 [Collybia nuda]